MDFEWEVVTSTRESLSHGGPSFHTPRKPKGEGWVLDRVELKTDTLYISPKDGWGTPRCATFVTLMEVWKRPIPTEK